MRTRWWECSTTSVCTRSSAGVPTPSPNCGIDTAGSSPGRKNQTTSGSTGSAGRLPDGTAVGTVQAPGSTLADARTVADVAWVIGIAWQGRGYAGEAALALVDW